MGAAILRALRVDRECREEVLSAVSRAMVPSRDSMLEAFKDAKGERSSVGGPFVGTGGAERSPALSRARGFVVLVAAVGLAFVLGVAVGRSTASPEALAAGGDSTGGALDGLDASESPWISADDEKPAVAPTESVSPLLDPRNKYTIVAISYTRNNDALAYRTYDHLLAKGLQAFKPFSTRNGMIVVVVGAAPKESGLADSLSRLQRLSGPDGKGRPYEGAYAQPIKKLLPGE
jgi:hypothetical protein